MKGQITKTVKPFTDAQAKALKGNFNMGMDKGAGKKKGTTTKKKGK